ncbi:three-helix bundle dimerization domain-containing protein [Sinomonas sp. ASV486]|uniref:three-helix bundle dimerization domain-containing protein n=1 Tax=Sinomonas sp. ASV486 TaxID=3051170 RepID=UPI0035A6A6F4
MSETETDKDAIVRAVAGRLSARFPMVPRPHLEGIVGEEYDALAEGRITTYIPTLIEHGARTRLRQESSVKASGRPF